MQNCPKLAQCEIKDIEIEDVTCVDWTNLQHMQISKIINMKNKTKSSQAQIKYGAGNG